MVQCIEKELAYTVSSADKPVLSPEIFNKFANQFLDPELLYLQCNSPDGAMEAAEEYTKSLLGPSGTPCHSYSSVEEVSAKDDSGDMSFSMSKYSSDVLKMMYMMRSHHMLTDVILEVGTELFHVHKVVLSAASPYFKAMFTGGLKECEMSRVKLQGVSFNMSLIF